MKFLNKSILTILAALASAGQAVAFTCEVSLLTKGNGKDKITLYLVGDCHEQFKKIEYCPTGVNVTLQNAWPLDQSNTQRIVKLATKLNAKVFVEEGQKIDVSEEDDKENQSFLRQLYFLKSENIHCFDPRTEILKILASTYDSKSPVWHAQDSPELEAMAGFGKACKTISEQYKTYCETKLQDQDLALAFKEILTGFSLKEFMKNVIMASSDNQEKDLQKIGSSFYQKFQEHIKTLDDDHFNHSNNESICYRIVSYYLQTFLDLQILIELDREIRRGVKNFFICAGFNHTNNLTNILKKQFTLKTLVSSKFDHLKEIDLTTINGFQHKNKKSCCF